MLSIIAIFSNSNNRLLNYGYRPSLLLKHLFSIKNTEGKIQKWKWETKVNVWSAFHGLLYQLTCSHGTYFRSNQKLYISLTSTNQIMKFHSLIFNRFARFIHTTWIDPLSLALRPSTAPSNSIKVPVNVHESWFMLQLKYLLHGF